MTRRPPSRWPAPLAVALGLALLACPGKEPRPPDLLLVVLDTARADRMSAYGHERPTTPQLEALAEVGVLFEDVTAQAPWTVPSHASLFTGVPPWVHGAYKGAARAGVSGRLRRDLPTLAEELGRAGYRSEAYVSNHWLAPELGLMRGFDQVRVFERDPALVEAVAERLHAPLSEDRRPLFLFVNLMTAHSPYYEGPGDWALEDAALLDPAHAPAWVRPFLAEDRPGLDFLRHDAASGLDGRTLYSAGELAIPEPGLRALRRLYDAGIHGGDYLLSRLVAAWSRHRAREVLAVTSDHGDALGEHRLLDHHSSVYPEVLHVPLVIAAPGRLPAGRRVAAPVALMDLQPTLLALAGLEAENSLLPLARGESREGPREVISAMAGHDAGFAANLGGRFARTWYLHRESGRALVFDDRSAAELYELERDPGMEHDLAPDRPERVARMLGRARERIEGERSDAPVEALHVPEATAARLRALGYSFATPAGRDAGP